MAKSWTIEVYTMTDEGDPKAHLRNFSSRIQSWSCRVRPEDEGFHFDSEDDEDLEEDLDEDQDDLDGDDGSGPVTQYEVSLVHDLNAAVFNELNTHVFDQKEQPMVMVKVTYHTLSLKHEPVPVFCHYLAGFLYFRTGDLGGNRETEDRLTLVTDLEVIQSSFYSDPANHDAVAAMLHAETSLRAH